MDVTNTSVLSGHDKWHDTNENEGACFTPDSSSLLRLEQASPDQNNLCIKHEDSFRTANTELSHESLQSLLDENKTVAHISVEMKESPI